MTGNLLAAPVYLTYKGDYVIVNHTYVIEVGDSDPLYDTASATGIDPVTGGFSLSYPGVIDIIHPSIDIIKYVSDDGITWEDANSPTGPIIPVGDNVYFKVNVTNTGDCQLINISVNDNLYGSVFNNGLLTTLAPGTWDESNVYTLPDAIAGQHTNIATVTGTPPVGPNVTDNDPANYYGANPCINIIKYVSEDGITWEDANSPTGPIIPVGDNVYFKVNVSNCGNIQLTNISINDNLYGPVFNNGLLTTLAPGTWDESNVYTLPDAITGQHTNIATVNCTQGATDNDPANYYGEEQQYGCTYTPGYWMTHSKYGPASQEDPTWMDLPDMDGDGNIEGPDEIFYGNVYGLTWHSIMNFSSKEAKALGIRWKSVQRYQHLAFHYVAAVLNGIMNGNLPQGVADDLADAEAILEAYPDMKIHLVDYVEAGILAANLADFNQGSIPNWPHCDDEPLVVEEIQSLGNSWVTYITYNSRNKDPVDREFQFLKWIEFIREKLAIILENLRTT